MTYVIYIINGGFIMNKRSQALNTLNLVTFFFHQEFENDYRIKHVITKTNWGHRLHTHNFFEIFFCLSSNMRFLINETVYSLRENDLILLNSADVHGIINDTNLLFERYVIEFDPNYTADFCQYYNVLEVFETESHPHILHLNTNQTQIFLSLFNKLYSYENPQDTYAWPLYRKIAFAELMLQINNFASNSNIPAIEDEDPKTNRMQNILSYINNHLSDNLSITSLAERFYISPSYLSSIFKTFTGYSVNNYIINQRIILATKLLKQNLSVQEVADKSGFYNYAHFIRTFKKYTGYAPKQYMKTLSSKCTHDL